MKVLKLRAIWAIIRNRTVIWNTEIENGTIKTKTPKSVICYNTFRKTELIKKL